MKTIKKIVFTGGPCGGKTTFTSRAKEVFAEHGYRVIIDNESATDLISGGISPATMGMFEFQKYCIELQLKKEELAYKAALEIDGDKVLIFVDRGILDDKSFVTDEEWEIVISSFDLTEQDILKRYDMVLHLTSAANGAEDAYTYSTNSARYETVEQARKVDIRTLEVWQNHPNRVVIGNDTDFNNKIINAMRAVFSFLGDEKPIETYRKYLVEFDDKVLEKIKLENNFMHVHILQHYLKSLTNLERRIRLRERDGDKLYSYSEAKYIQTNKRIKMDRVLTERQYSELLPEIDNSLNIIDKNRYSFFYDHRFSKIDVYSFDKSKALLSVSASENDVVLLPEYIRVIKDVSNDVNYKNYYLAKNQKF